MAHTTQDILELMARRRPQEPQFGPEPPWMAQNRFAAPARPQASLERYRRPGDTTGFTPGANPEMEDLAAQVGNRDLSWWEKLVAAAGLTTGIVQGKAGKRSPQPRELDKLGFYSHALEAAKALQRNSGPPQGFLNDLQKAGVKKAEIEATGLGRWLEKRADAQQPVNRDELVEFLRQNRVQLKETVYGEPLPYKIWPKGDGSFAVIDAANGKEVQTVSGMDEAMRVAADRNRALGKANPPPIRWKRAGGQNLLLDPDNPSNREAVVHLEYPRDQAIGQRMREITKRSGEIAKELDRLGVPAEVAGTRTAADAHPLHHEWQALRDESQALQRERDRDYPTYREPHFDTVPNYLFHLRGGMYKDLQGRNVWLGDEAQSTRAQAIRDSKAGPRDEGKIAELEKRFQEATTKHGATFDAATQWLYDSGWPPMAGGREPTRMEIHQALTKQHEQPLARQHMNAIQSAADDMKLLSAEHLAAQNAPSGHPLVNSMNQVDTTMLRRLIQQAVESKAEGLALTPGDLQNERYNLSKHINEIEVNHKPDGHRSVYLVKPDGEVLDVLNVRPNGTVDGTSHLVDYKDKPLHELVGRGWADRIMASKQSEAFKTEGLDVGGQGMREYYDKTYPNVLEKELRRLDPQWPGRGQTQLQVGNMSQEAADQHGYTVAGEGPNRKSLLEPVFHHFPITPKIREEVGKGLPLFSLAPLALLPGLLGDPRRPDEEPGEEDPFAHAY